jgi:IMP and pyridine-specific 5'-nucleotidase
MLQTYLNAKPEETLHVGDQFLSTGNDYATRASWYVIIRHFRMWESSPPTYTNLFSCTLWIISPQETQEALVQLADILEKQK